MSITKAVLRFAAPLPKIEQFDRFLFLGPHPDDIEIGAGATAARLAAAGKQVTFLICTDGRYGLDYAPEGTMPEALIEMRQRESIAAAKLLGVTDVRFLPFEDGGFYDEDNLLRAVAGGALRAGPVRRKRMPRGSSARRRMRQAAGVRGKLAAGHGAPRRGTGSGSGDRVLHDGKAKSVCGDAGVFRAAAGSAALPREPVSGGRHGASIRAALSEAAGGRFRHSKRKRTGGRISRARTNADALSAGSGQVIQNKNARRIRGMTTLRIRLALVFNEAPERREGQAPPLRRLLCPVFNNRLYCCRCGIRCRRRGRRFPDGRSSGRGRSLRRRRCG